MAVLRVPECEGVAIFVYRLPPTREGVTAHIYLTQLARIDEYGCANEKKIVRSDYKQSTSIHRKHLNHATTRAGECFYGVGWAISFLPDKLLID